MLTKLTLEGFKSFRKLELELRPLNVLVGANGSGKSNLVSFFKFIRDLGSGRLHDQVTKSGGANSILRYGKKQTSIISASLDFVTDKYNVKLEPDDFDSLQITLEQFLALPSGKGHGTSERSRTPESRIFLSEISPLLFEDKYLTEYQRFKLLLTGIKTYHFQDTSSTSGFKSTSRINDNIELSADGGNLAPMLYRILVEHKNAYRAIRDVIRGIAPYFDDFLLRPNPLNPDTIRLEWHERNSDFPFLAKDISDGTLRFMALVTLLLQPDPPAITVIDEPELGLHPFAIEKLAGLLRVASSRTQVIVATQNPQLVSALEPEDVIVVDREDGETTMRRLDAVVLADWLEEYSLGELWQKNILGGGINPNVARSGNTS